MKFNRKLKKIKNPICYHSNKSLAVITLAVGAAMPIVINKIAFVKGRNYEFFLNGNHRNYIWRGSNIRYTVKGHGEPVLLLHSVACGCDSYEFRKNFEVLSKYFIVYAVDLLGFGLSDSPDLDYSPQLYVDFIRSFILEVINHETHVIAISLSGAYAIKAASQTPELMDKIVLISPTGLIKPDSNNPNNLLRNVFHSPYIGTTLYNRMTCQQFIKHFLETNVYYNKFMVTPEMVTHYYNSSHFKGVCSKYAIAALLSKKLNLTVSEEIQGIKNPILTVWGRNSKLSKDDEWDAFKKINPEVSAIVYEECGSLPNDEVSHEFNRDVVHFLIK